MGCGARGAGRDRGFCLKILGAIRSEADEHSPSGELPACSRSPLAPFVAFPEKSLISAFRAIYEQNLALLTALCSPGLTESCG